MNSLDWLQGLNNTLNVIAWPAVVLIVTFSFRRVLSDLIGRISQVEGSFGQNQLKFEVQQIVETNVARVAELENQGKSVEARQLTSDTAQIISQLYGLTRQDLDYLVELSEGRKPKRRWGAIHLVRAGLIEFDGGKLTDQGRSLIERYKSFIGRAAVS